MSFAAWSALRLNIGRSHRRIAIPKAVVRSAAARHARYWSKADRRLSEGRSAETAARQRPLLPESREINQTAGQCIVLGRRGCGKRCQERPHRGVVLSGKFVYVRAGGALPPATGEGAAYIAHNGDLYVV